MFVMMWGFHRTVLRDVVFAVLFAGSAGAAHVVTVLAHGSGDLRAVDTEIVVWPALGVLCLWAGTSRRDAALRTTVAMVLAVAAVGLAALSWSAAALIFVVCNLIAAWVFVLTARRWGRHLWGLGGRAGLTRVHDLTPVLVGAIVGGLASTATGLGVGALLGSHPDVLLAARWWERGAVGILVTVVLGMLIVQPLVSRGPGTRSSRLSAAIVFPHHQRSGELAIVVAVSLALAVTIVSQPSLDSLAFLLVLPAVWTGLRFPPLVTALYAAVLGRGVLIATLVGRGPFLVDGESQLVRAMLAQGFLVVVLLTGLVLSLGRSELLRTSDALSVSERRSLERAQLFEAVLVTMEDGMAVVDEQGRVLMANPAAARVLGLPETEWPDMEAVVENLYHPDGTKVRSADLPGVRALAGEERPSAMFQVRLADGSSRVLTISARALRHPVGASRTTSKDLAVVNLRDTTAESLHKDTLANFAGTVAHDLNTPLTMINGWAELLIDGFGSGSVSAPEGTPVAEKIYASAQRMRDVVRDLLAYTVARDQSLRLRDVSIERVVGSVASFLEGTENAPRVTVDAAVDVRADEALVRQLFENLVGNAVKYVPKGVRPVIGVSARAGSELGTVEIRVTDNGVGIPPAERETVFAPYHRVGRADETGRGFGLGLAICKRIVDRHGGQIWAEDPPGGPGVTICLTLPIAASAASAAKGSSGAAAAEALPVA